MTQGPARSGHRRQAYLRGYAEHLHLHAAQLDRNVTAFRIRLRVG